MVTHPLLKTTLTGLRRTYLRFLVFRPKLGETKRFPPFLDHMNGKFFLGGSRFRSGKIDPKLAVGGCVAAQPWSGALSKIDNFGPKTSTFWHKNSEKEIFNKKKWKMVKTMVKTQSKLVKMVKMVQNDPKWSKMVPNGSK